MSKTSGVGLIAVGVKVSLKLSKGFPFILKALKGAGAGKTGLAAASFGGWAILFTWQFAVLIVGMIFLHELGHLVTMKYFHMKVKGIYLIPFLGAAVVSEEDFPDRKTEVIVALAGPFVGLLLALLALVVWYVTKVPLWAGVASWIALVNVFNLIPISPLDGGRVFKSIAFSLHSWIGFGIMALGVVGAVVVAAVFGLWLLVFVGLLGALDLVREIRNIQKTKKMDSLMSLLKARDVLVADDAVGENIVSLDFHCDTFKLGLYPRASIKADRERLKSLIHQERKLSETNFLRYLYSNKDNMCIDRTLQDLDAGVSRLWLYNVYPDSYKSQMPKLKILQSAVMYGGLIALLLWIMNTVSHISGAKEAFQLLT